MNWTAKVRLVRYYWQLCVGLASLLLFSPFWRLALSLQQRRRLTGFSAFEAAAKTASTASRYSRRWLGSNCRDKMLPAVLLHWNELQRLVGGLRRDCRPQQQYPHLQVNYQRWEQLQVGHGGRLGGGQILHIGEIFRLVFKQCVYQYHWSRCTKSCPQTWWTFNQIASEYFFTSNHNGLFWLIYMIHSIWRIKFTNSSTTKFYFFTSNDNGLFWFVYMPFWQFFFRFGIPVAKRDIVRF